MGKSCSQYKSILQITWSQQVWIEYTSSYKQVHIKLWRKNPVHQVFRLEIIVIRNDYVIKNDCDAIRNDYVIRNDDVIRNDYDVIRNDYDITKKHCHITIHKSPAESNLLK